MQLLDTIAAVSTPYGKGGVAMLRISGGDAIAIASRIFCPMNGKPLAEAPVRTAVYGRILAPEADGSLQPVDDGIATVFAAPASFTGEDTVEVCCHGGILMTQTVLSALLTAGARAAEPGEFTRRAFLNGKMGLDAAEALGSLLEAENRSQLTLAFGGMHGTLEVRGQEIYTRLRGVMSAVLANIDFPDEDLADMSRQEMCEQVSACERALRALADTYRTGHAVAEGVVTAICGRTNVGKSSLYNRLVGRDAAIVTDIAGTTRDVLSERVSLGRVTLRLSDTAGLREASDRVEQIGIERARRAMDEAELILAVFDVSAPLSEEEHRLLSTLSDYAARNITVLPILNKCDTNTPCTQTAETVERALGTPIRLSAVTGQGLDALIDRVETLFVDGSIDMRNDAVVVNARQYASVLRALESVARAREGLESGLPLDLCCVDVECAMSELSRMDGRAVDEDIVSEIFSHFCVGK